ncbi:hypothetical protein SCAR479_08172 [Seiridium cardinale]|uniref:Uncharacterized protein n=1 Tax=Seiridium cardinale TaxID=138064 RepID=A0ABR2XNK9_9PEZI
MASLVAILSWLALFATLSLSNDDLQAQIRIGLQPSRPTDQDSVNRIRLNFSSPAPHLFHSTFSLLQQLPNTVFPNGHTVAPVFIPAYTLLYHARRDADSPASPEWVAFDSDMSYGIMGGHRNVWMWSYQTTQPVKALYFDGESGNLQGLGQFDAQMLLLYGNVTGPDRTDDLDREYARALGLCKWLSEAGLGGKGWGFEGVVRMNAGFEMIWCDFSSESIKLISRINVTAPQLPKEDEKSDNNDMTKNQGDDGLGESITDRISTYPLPLILTKPERPTRTPDLPSMPPNWRDQLRREPFLRTRSWGWFDSATWHYGSSGIGFHVGETRAKVLSCGTLSFYSRHFANQSLNRAVEERKRLNLTDSGLWKGPAEDGNRTVALRELGRRRRFHHLEYVNPDEARLMRSGLESALKMILGNDKCSGADWMLIVSEIVQRTSRLLKNFEVLLYSSPGDWRNQTEVREWMHGLRGQSHSFMVNYLQYPASQDSSAWSTRSELFNKTYSLCRYRYIRLFEDDSLVAEEIELRWAVEETFGAICLVQLTVGFGIEQTWVETYGRSFSNDSIPRVALQKRSRLWGNQLSELIAWLGWESEYIACKEVCAVDERCFIPMWPITRPELSDEGMGSASLPSEFRLSLRSTPPSLSDPGSSKTSRRPWIHTDETDLWEPKCVKDVCIEGLCWI